MILKMTRTDVQSALGVCHGELPVKTTKAFLAGLGASALLSAAVLLVLVVGSGLVAVGEAPRFGAGDPLEQVIVEDEASGGAARDSPIARRFAVPAVRQEVPDPVVAVSRPPRESIRGEPPADRPRSESSGGAGAPRDTGGGAGSAQVPTPPVGGGADKLSPLPSPPDAATEAAGAIGGGVTLGAAHRG
jgi:hypothetical protein